ncbi:MAG: Trk system potassium transporter TrkA [Desulfovibrionaceae bacterium]
MFFTGSLRSKVKRDRIIVIGAGQVGYYVSKRLALEGKNVVVIDTNESRLRGIVSSIDVQTIVADAFSSRVLLDAGIEDASVIIAVTNSDVLNMSVCFLSHVLNPLVSKIVRIREQDVVPLYPKFKEIVPTLTAFINPEESVVKSIVRSLSLPGLNEYSEFMNGQVKLACFHVTEGPLLGVPLRETRVFFDNHEFIIAAINRNGKLYIPKGSSVLQENDHVYFSFTEKGIAPMLKSMGKEACSIKNVIIAGGGNVGFKLAKELESLGIASIKLLEINNERAHFLAEHLDKALVIGGDATDESVLEGLAPSEIDAFISLTGDEENNLIACLLAHSLGIKDTVCRLDKRSYISLAHLVGIEHTITPRLSAVNTILNCIRRGRVISSISVGDDAAEALEFIVTSTLSIANKVISEIALPDKCIILALIKDIGVIMAQGDTVLEIGSRVLLMADRTVVPEVDKLFSS